MVGLVHQHVHEKHLCLKEGKQVKCNSKLVNLSSILIDDVIRGRNNSPCTSSLQGRSSDAPHKVSLRVRVNSSLLSLCAGPCRPWTRVICRWSDPQILSKCVSCCKRNAPTLQQVWLIFPKKDWCLYNHRSDFFGPFYVRRSRSTGVLLPICLL